MRTTLARLLALLLLAASFVATPPAAGEEPLRFDGHSVLRAVPETEAQLDAILDLTPDVWSHGAAVGRPVDFRLPPDLLDDLDRTGIPYEVLIDDLQPLIDRQQQPINPLGGGWFTAYKTYGEHMAYIDELAAVNPDIATVVHVGDSLEGRAIRGLRIVGEGAGQPQFVIQGCQHAREWVSPMVCQFIADHLIRNYGIDPDVTQLLDAVEFVIVPMVNPDGYDYSWTNDRMWRKNRRNNGDGSFGVDLNRNWGVGWGGEGSSGNSSSQTYRGTAPFSEPESAAMRDFILSLPNVAAHLDMHSYSQLILAPWGHIPDLPDDHDIFQFLGESMQDLIFDVHGKTYVHGPAYSVLYPAAGIAPDWGYGTIGALGFTFELRDTGQYGFLLPPEQIIPNGEEIVPAMMFMADWIGSAVIFEFPDGRPSRIEPGTATPLPVEIQAVSGQELDLDRLLLHWRSGSDGVFTETPLNPLGGDLYEAVLPATPCGETLEYYLSAATTGGDVQTSPADAPAEVYAADAVNVDVAFADDFETDAGWTVENIDLEDGQWTRGFPEGAGRGAPDTDYDGSGRCYTTDNAEGNSDVDGGPTRLISPAIDLSASPDAIVSYARWFSNDDQDIDRLDVHVSNDDGTTWTLVESVSNTGGWTTHDFRVADFVEPTSQVRIRFSATDNPNDSVTEAAIDAFQVAVVSCDSTELTAVDVTTGTILDGGLDELTGSDDAYLHTRSGFGQTFIDLHNMTMTVSAATGVGSPATLDLTVESRIDEPSGTARVSLRNWSTGEFESVGTYSIGTTEEAVTISDIPAADYVNGSGEIDAQLRHVVFVPFLAFTFESFVDEVAIEVR